MDGTSVGETLGSQVGIFEGFAVGQTVGCASKCIRSEAKQIHELRLALSTEMKMG